MDLSFTKAIAEAIRKVGGRALIVGGFVRDHILNLDPKDIDIEVYNLSIDKLEKVLQAFGDVHVVGKSFGVLKVAGLDVSIPRSDSKIGAGHRGFNITPNPKMSVREAARRRDFTMNSMALNPLTLEIEDPFGGRSDLKARILRMTDSSSFVEDPLRIIRAAQFIARFGLRPDDALIQTSTEMAHTLKELPGDRLWEEWVKLLLKGAIPSAGIRFLHDVEANDFLFPEISALNGCIQDPEYHPEGDVFIHSNMALDVAASMRTGDPEHDLQLMFGALCHDFGKPMTTKFIDGRWRSRGHEEAGVKPTQSFMERIRAPQMLIAQVCALVRDHLAPAHFSHPRNKNAGAKAYRRLARKLEFAGTNLEMLHKVACADHFGRTTEDSLKREFPAGQKFLAKAREISVDKIAEKDVVMGRHLIARGMKPGKEFGIILTKCREVQYETGLKDPEKILNRVFNGNDKWER